MTFPTLQLLLEEQVSLEDLARDIVSSAGPWLSASGFKYNPDNVLYRGMYSGNLGTSIRPGAWLKQSRKDRLPKDSHEWLHKALDDAFKAHMGVAMRSEGVFASNTISQSSGYGSARIMIPIGNFRYAWSETVADAWEVFQERTSVWGRLQPDVVADAVDAEYERKFGEKITSSDTHSFKEAFPNGNKDPIFQQIMAEALMQSLPKVYRMDEGLDEYFSSRNRSHEIMVAVDGEYLVIDSKVWISLSPMIQNLL